MSLLAVVCGAAGNMSFESGFDGWSAGTNMSIDRAVFHSGENSAKVVVKDPLKDTVYLSRRIPVTGGAAYAASCWIRTEGVELATCRDTSVGAGMIIEWADAQGKYIGWGASTYNNFGTRDWFRIESGLMRAPVNATRALVTLCLRGRGTAWFDDFELDRSTLPVKKKSPADGTVISNNVPEFAWSLSSGITNYVLRLSRDPAFPGGGEVIVECGGRLQRRLEQPLSKGRWFWKVTATGMEDNCPWRFDQTARADVDCLPPAVVGKAARVTDARQHFTVQVRERSGRMPSVEFAGVKAKPCGQGRDGAFVFTISPPDDGWKRGVTEADMITRDQAGNVGKFRFYLLNAPKPANAVTVDADGNYRVDGKPYFPLGIYQVTKPHLQEVKAAGFDLVHMYRWEKIAENEPCKDYLDACAAAGLRAFVGFDRGGYTGNGLKDGNLHAIVGRVGALADHPAMFCWYLYDEPEHHKQFVAPDMMEDYAELVRSLDPWHPVVMSTWANIAYRRSWDSHWSQSYGLPQKVFADYTKYRANLGDSPITMILGAYDDGLSRKMRLKQPFGPDEFWLDAACFRASANIALAQGANGLLWWWFAKEDGYYYSVCRSPLAWRGLKEAVRDISALRPFLMEPGRVSRGVGGTSGSEVVWWVKETRSCTLARVVNTSEKPVEVKLDLPGLGRREVRLGRYEVRQFSEKRSQ